MYHHRCHGYWDAWVYHPGPEAEGRATAHMRHLLSCACFSEAVYVRVTNRDDHAQLALTGVSGINIELDREAGRDAAGQPGTTGSHFTGIMSRQNPELERTEETTD